MPNMKQATSAPRYPYYNDEQRFQDAGRTYLSQSVQYVDVRNVEVGSLQSAGQDHLS
jgi:hypothetical protein